MVSSSLRHLLVKMKMLSKKKTRATTKSNKIILMIKLHSRKKKKMMTMSLILEELKWISSKRELGKF